MTHLHFELSGRTMTHLHFELSGRILAQSDVVSAREWVRASANMFFLEWGLGE